MLGSDNSVPAQMNTKAKPRHLLKIDVSKSQIFYFK